MTNVVKGRALLRECRALHTVKALAFHSDIMKKSIEKAGFPVLWGLEVESFMSLPQRPTGISNYAEAYSKSIAQSPTCSSPASIK